MIMTQVCEYSSTSSYGSAMNTRRASCCLGEGQTKLVLKSILGDLMQVVLSWLCHGFVGAHPVRNKFTHFRSARRANIEKSRIRRSYHSNLFLHR
jgi:hypothetical protein